MTSVRARAFNAVIRATVRRRDWGPEAVAVRRARRLFGVPELLQRIATRDLELEPVAAEGVRGEWLIPNRPAEGAILYLHGGGYVACSAATHRPVTAALARWSGVRVFALDYRLAPEHRFPAAVDDAIAGYEWLLRQGLKPGTLAVGGDSAGGGLTLSMALRARARNLPLPACLVGLSPWTDLAGTGASVQTNDGRCAMFRPENIGTFASAYLGGASPRDPEASPLLADLGGLPPSLFQVGSTELLLDDARRVHDKIREAGGTSRLEIFDDVCHGWHLLDGFIPEARVALRQAAEFVRLHVAPRATVAENGTVGRFASAVSPSRD